MSDTGGYPAGAQYDPRAPYNEKENPEIEITVCISKTYHKTLKVKVRDYEIVDEYVDEDGLYCCERDFSNCDLYGAVRSQYGDLHPNETWTEDEEEVILDKD